MEEFSSQLIESEQNGNLLECIYDVFYRDRNNQDHLLKEIADLHNSNKIDVIASFNKLEPGGDPVIDLNMCGYIFERLLPQFQSAAGPILRCLIHLSKVINNGRVVIHDTNGLIKYLELNLNRIKEALEIAVNDSDLFSLISAILISGSKYELEVFVNKATELSGHSNPEVCANAIRALGLIEYSSNKKLAEKVLNTIDAISKDCTDDVINSRLLKAAFFLYKDIPEKQTETIEIINRAIKDHGDLTLHAASELFCYEIANLPPQLLSVLQNGLLKFNINNGGTLNNIDLGLFNMLINGKINEATTFLENILINKNDPNIFREFRPFIDELYKDKIFLNKLITKWLLSNNTILCHAAADISNKNIDNGSEFRADYEQIKNFNNEERLHLVRRACGWFYFKPISAISFIVSLTNSSNTEQIAEVLFYPLIISYPGLGREYLTNICADSPKEIKAVINIVLNNLDKHQDAIKSAHDIDELSPSIKQIEEYSLYMQKRFEQANDKASEEPIMQLFSNPSQIMYGKSSVYYCSAAPGAPKQRQEIDLQPYSYSFESSSLETLDPHGLNNLLRTFKQ